MCGGCLIRFGSCVCVQSMAECMYLSLINIGVCVCMCADVTCKYAPIYNLCDLYYRFVCSITCLCCCKCKYFGVPLYVFKLMSFILVKLNCPVRDD